MTRPNAWFGGVLPLLVCCVLLAFATTSAAQWAPLQEALSEQPDVHVRRMLDTPFVHVYTPPDQMGNFSERRLEKVVKHVYHSAFVHDERSEWTELKSADVVPYARANKGAEERAIERELEMGYRLYRLGELEEATQTLESALRAIEGTGVAFADEQAVADGWHVLARAYQERALSDPDAPDELASNMRLALQEWIRLRPQERIDGDRYPRRFVEAWRQVYFEQLASTAAVLSMRRAEAKYIAKTLDVDVVPDVRITQRGDRGTIAVRVYDAVADRFAYDAILPWNGNASALEDALSRAFSVAKECLEMRAVPQKGRKRLLHRNYLSVESLLFFYAERPTKRAFLNSGIRIAGHHYVTPVVGFFADLSVSFSRRDRAGELLETVQTQSLSAGVSFQHERPRFRAFVDAGLEVSRRSELKMTSSFWCRVSGGAPTSYDGQRGCDPADVFSQRPSALMGVRLSGGIGARIAGPLWWQMSITTTLYLVPFGNRGVDRPIGGTTGLVYSF